MVYGAGKFKAQAGLAIQLIIRMHEVTRGEPLSAEAKAQVGRSVGFQMWAGA